MTHYIDKDTLVSEIERRIENLHKLGDDDFLKKYYEEQYGCVKAYRSIVSSLNALDLEKESEQIADDIMINVQSNKYGTCVYNTTRCDFNHSHLMLAARKGIELGLKVAQKGE